MTVKTLEPTFTYGPFPATDATNLAMRTGVTQAEAAEMLETAWHQVEAFTGRNYRETLTASIIVTVASPTAFRWPRYPYPKKLKIEVLSNGSWVPHHETHTPTGLIELEPFTVYRLQQDGPTPPAPIGSHVTQAVKLLALYQLVHDPARREFRSQSAGDSSFTRETTNNPIWASGAGAMLSGEVRL